MRPPFLRTGVRATGGPGAPATSCAGLMSFDVNALIAASPSAVLSAGEPLYVQARYRDVDDVYGSGLSDGAAMTILP